jgi:hypothetical protein
MSNIRKVKTFLQFLLSNQIHDIQAKAILDTVDKSQLLALSEIAYNLLHANLQLSEKELKEINKKKWLLKIVADKKNTQQKKDTIYKYSKSLLKLLSMFRKPLSELLE